MIRNLFTWDNKTQDQRIIDLYIQIPSLDWSLYPDEIIEKHEEYKNFLEKEAIKAMKRKGLITNL